MIMVMMCGGIFDNCIYLNEWHYFDVCSILIFALFYIFLYGIIYVAQFWRIHYFDLLHYVIVWHDSCVRYYFNNCFILMCTTFLMASLFWIMANLNAWHYFHVYHYFDHCIILKCVTIWRVVLHYFLNCIIFMFITIFVTTIF